MTKKKCTRCGSEYFNKVRGEIVCSECGLVMVETMVDAEPDVLDEADIDEIRAETKSKKNKTLIFQKVKLHGK